jgi:hypothetical protein
VTAKALGLRHYKRRNNMRYNNEAALPVIAVIVVAVLVVASIGIYYYAASAGYGSDDDYVPTLEIELRSKSNGVIYDADITMDVDNAQFIDYFFSAASTASDPGFPAGNTVLEVFIFDEPISANMPSDSILFEETYKVGNLYGYQVDGIQETTWTIELPMLKDIAPDNEGAAYIYIQVKAGGATIGTKRVTCNPEAA